MEEEEEKEKEYSLCLHCSLAATAHRACPREWLRAADWEEAALHSAQVLQPLCSAAAPSTDPLWAALHWVPLSGIALHLLPTPLITVYENTENEYTEM